MSSLSSAIQEFDVAGITVTHPISPGQAERLEALCPALVALHKGQSADSSAMVAGLKAVAEIAARAHNSPLSPASGRAWAATWMAMPAIAGSKLRITSAGGSELEFFLDAGGAFYYGVLIATNLDPDSDPIPFQVSTGLADGLVHLSTGQNEVSLPLGPSAGSLGWTHAPTFYDPSSALAAAIAAAAAAQTNGFRDSATASPPSPLRKPSEAFATASPILRPETAAPPQRHCPACGKPVASAVVRFCTGCGAALVRL